MGAYRKFALAGVSLFSLSLPAFAQDAPAGAETYDSVEVEEIVVQARRRGESLQDVPLVVNAVTSDDIDKLNLRNFQEITSVVPGLSLVPAANGIGSASSLRGINHDVLVSGENGTIQYYLNDAPIESSLILQAMYDVAQVEVLRGPQGTLRGRATPSGSITVSSRRPDLAQVGGYVNGTLATKGALNFNFGLNVPIIEDKLAVRIAGLHDRTRGNRVRSINSDVKPERETDSLRATARFEPFDFLKLGFTYQTLQSKGRQFDHVQSYSLLNPDASPTAGTPDYGVIRPGDRLSISALPREISQKFDFYNWNAELSLMGQKLVYVGAHSSSVFKPVTPNDPGNLFPTVTATQSVLTKGTRTSHEVRLQNDDRVFGMFDYVIGYFRNETNGTTNVLAETPVGLPGGAVFVNLTPIDIGNSVGTEESIFGNVVAHIGDSTELSGGLRRIHYTNEPTSFVLAGQSRPEVLLPYDLKKTVYNASVRHRLNDNLMVYAATGSSFRPPVVAVGDFQAPGVAYSPIELAHVKLAPETSKSYEVGVKSQWLDRRLTVNATYYHQKYKNYPFRAGEPGIPYVSFQQTPFGTFPTVSRFTFISAVPVKVDGVEAEVAFNPSERFSLASTINYARSKIGNAMLACLDANGDGIPDAQLPASGQALLDAYGGEHLAECPGGGQRANFQPDWSGSVRAEYSHPLSDRVDGYLRGLVNWKGKSETDPNNPFDAVDAYALVNLYAGVRAPDGAWEVSLYGKNVTNKVAFVSADGLPISGRTVAGSILSRYSILAVTPPREFGVNVRVAFGSR